jgi:hypothetical protein
MSALSGQRFGRWRVRCVERPVDSYTLVSGASRSCGCLRGEILSAQNLERWAAYRAERQTHSTLPSF